MSRRGKNTWAQLAEKPPAEVNLVSDQLNVGPDGEFLLTIDFGLGDDHPRGLDVRTCFPSPRSRRAVDEARALPPQFLLSFEGNVAEFREEGNLRVDFFRAFGTINEIAGLDTTDSDGKEIAHNLANNNPEACVRRGVNNHQFDKLQEARPDAPTTLVRARCPPSPHFPSRRTPRHAPPRRMAGVRRVREVG